MPSSPSSSSRSTWRPAAASARRLRTLRTAMFRLPFCTRLILTLIIAFYAVAALQSKFDVVAWGGLVPKEVGMQSLYRLNTYPLIHLGFFHALFNTLALVPLLERFEAEHGTLLSAALFGGPLSTLPAAGYLLVERGILRRNTAVQGASVWVFVMLGTEAIKAYRANPYFNIATYRIPTWTSPLLVLVFVTALVPNTSFLGHLSAVGVGYIYGLGYLRVIQPPERVLRWAEGKLNLLGRLPHYVSVDQKTFGRYGVLDRPTTTVSAATSSSSEAIGIPMGFLGGGQRLGP